MSRSTLFRSTAQFACAPELLLGHFLFGMALLCKVNGCQQCHMGSWGLPTCVFGWWWVVVLGAWQPACLQIHVWAVPRSPCNAAHKLAMYRHSVLHNVSTVALIIVQQPIYIHQRKRVSKVWNWKYVIIEQKFQHNCSISQISLNCSCHLRLAALPKFDPGILPRCYLMS